MIDLRPVGYIVGWLVAGLGLSMVFPMLLDLWDRQGNAGAFGLSAFLSVLVGGTLALACAHDRRTDLSLREGFLLTTGIWLIFPAVGALPMMLGDPGLGLADGYFEAMSALTTTGGTVIVGLDHQPRGLLLWRGLMQWIGGIGVVLLAMILLPVLKIGGMQLLRNADFDTLGKILPRTREIVLSIGSVYFSLTFACMLGYSWSGMSTFDAAVHAMTTVATGGMANYDASFGQFGAATQYVGTVFMLLGAMSFGRFVQFATGNASALFGDSQIRAFLLIYAGFVAALVAARLLQGDPLTETLLREVLFNLASVITTTGFASTDYLLWGSLAWVLIFCATLVCGCSGSTAGGPKVFRYQLLGLAIRQEVKRLHSPSIVFVPHYQGARVSEGVMNSVMAFFMIFFLTLGIGSVLLILMGVDPVTAISGIATCLSNVGPGLGPEIGPAGNFAGLSDPVKWVLSFAMLAGRLELFPVLMLMSTMFWRR